MCMYIYIHIYIYITIYHYLSIYIYIHKYCVYICIVLGGLWLTSFDIRAPDPQTAGDF